MNPLVLIPARMASTRLPGKPLADICGKPMIVQVAIRAARAGLPVAVACDGEPIAKAVTEAGFQAVLTEPGLPSGSDRIYQALMRIDAEGAYDVVINVQGDMPLLDPAYITQVLALLDDPAVDIATLAAPITQAREMHDPAVVKPVIAFHHGAPRGRALYFTRATAPGGEGPLYHHIGIYAYRRAALEQFVALPPSPLEIREKLEQLRAVEAGMRMEIAIVGGVPLGVDTPETLALARSWYERDKL